MVVVVFGGMCMKIATCVVSYFWPSLTHFLSHIKWKADSDWLGCIEYFLFLFWVLFVDIESDSKFPFSLFVFLGRKFRLCLHFYIIVHSRLSDYYSECVQCFFPMLPCVHTMHGLFGFSLACMLVWFMEDKGVKLFSQELAIPTSLAKPAFSLYFPLQNSELSNNIIISWAYFL